MKIAVIGAGIAGLSAAWLLSRRHDVVIYERGSRFGGHSCTVEAAVAGGRQPVDVGFIVFNERTYPNLVALFDHLGVPTEASDMSFAVSLDGGRFEYGSSFPGYFAHSWTGAKISISPSATSSKPRASAPPFANAT